MCRAPCCNGNSSVCLSVHPWRWDIVIMYSLEFFENNFTVDSLGFLLSADHNISEILAGIWVEYGKVSFRVQNLCVISLKWGKIGSRLKIPRCASSFNSVSEILCCKNYYWVELITRLHHLIGFGITLQKPSVCYIMPVGVHTPLPKYPSGDWQLLSRSRSRLVRIDWCMPKTTTLDDLEGSSCTLFQNTCAMVRPQAEGSPCAWEVPSSFSSFFEVQYVAHQKSLGRLLVTRQ